MSVLARYKKGTTMTYHLVGQIGKISTRTPHLLGYILDGLLTLGGISCNVQWFSGQTGTRGD